ncbi:DNA-binding transcriptional LysR family regulator [Undibacterium sp. GrIS 1.8]|uniref:LysR family transcriptional regulator n=1 Tax=unclassified Undibacterium TaxID=2630295 RepID=UPI003397FB22
MTDRLDSMAILIAVVDAGSFSGAARRLAMPLATVSRKVGELEAHLKIRLLLRSTRQLALTEAGQSYVAACRRILEEVAQAERIAAGEYTMPKGELVITAPVVFGRLHVLPMVVEFLKKYPDIDVRLTLSDRNVHLLEDHIDVALRIGALPDSDLIAIPVGAVRTVVCASPEYFVQRGKPTTPEQLAQHDCVSYDVLTSPHSWRFLQGKSEITVPIHSRLIVNTAEAAIDAAVAGVGVTRVLSYQIAAAKRQALLEIVLKSFESPDRPVNLVHAGQGILPLKLRAFLDFGSAYLKNRLSDAI